MGQISIRALDDTVIARLKKRAERRNMSLERLIRQELTALADQPDPMSANRFPYNLMAAAKGEGPLDTSGFVPRFNNPFADPESKE